jgi:hypothetical protein
MRIPIASALALAAIALLAQGAAAQPSKKNVPPLEKKVLSLEAARKMVGRRPRPSATTGAASSRSSTREAGSLCSSAWTMQG